MGWDGVRLRGTFHVFGDASARGPDKLHLCINRALNVPAEGLGGKDKADPYCKVLLDGVETGRTCTKQNSSRPLWGFEVFELNFPGHYTCT